MANILVIDDSAMSRKKIKKILEMNNHVIVGEAQDGDEGLRKYKELSPDLVTLDITMPNMNGLECLKEILSFNKDAKIIIISSLGKGDTILDALNNGAFNYLTKPFDDTLVLDAVTEALDEN
ncbi:MAG: response regulator [Clostridia bacterium]|nr:response regulator [Clostridia bacterium]